MQLSLPSPPTTANERALAGFSRQRFVGLTGSTLTLDAPAVEGLELVIKNGQALDPGSVGAGFTISGATITLAVAAIVTDVFQVFYWARGAN